MAFNPNIYVQEASYRASRLIHKTEGLVVKTGLRALMGGGAATVATKFSGPFREALGWNALIAEAPLTTGQILATGAGGLATAGVGLGVEAFLNNQEYKHFQKKLLEIYRPQIAALSGKERDLAGLDDLYAVAEINPSLQEELNRARSSRNNKNVAASVGTVSAFGAVFAAITFSPLGGVAAAAATAGALSVTGIGLAIVAAGIGIGAMLVTRSIAKKIGSKVRGLDVPSAEDLVCEISKAHRKEKIIEPEQVMGVYAMATPGLGGAIEESFSKPYHKLSAADKNLAMMQFGDGLDLANSAAMINEGTMNARELVFKVHGQETGVYPDAPLRERLIDLAGERLDPLQNRIEDLQEDALAKIDEWREKRRESAHQDDVAAAMDAGRKAPDHPDAAKASWRDKLGFSRDKEQAQSTDIPNL